MCNWWKHSGESWEGSIPKTPEQFPANSCSSPLSELLITHLLHPSLPPSPSEGPGQQAERCWKPNSVREYWIIFPPLLWAVGEGINLVLVNSSRSSRRRCSRIMRASLCMFLSCFFFCFVFFNLSFAGGKTCVYYWFKVIAMTKTTAEVSACDQVAGPFFFKGATGWLKFLCYWLLAAFCRHYAGRSAVTLACSQLCYCIGKQSRHLNALQKHSDALLLNPAKSQ